MRCAPEDSVTTRSPIRGNSRLVSAKWPRWLVPICSSKPSVVRPLGRGHDAGVVDQHVEVAVPVRRERAHRGEVGSGRAGAPRSCPVTVAAAASPLARSRTASTTWAPAAPSALASARPRPLLAPVIRKRAAVLAREVGDVHFEEEEGMPTNVVDGNNAVNVYISGRLPSVSAHRDTFLPPRQPPLGAAGRRRAHARATAAPALSLRELARELGVSHAAPRRHFADKQALLDALAETGFDRLGAELDEAIADAGSDFRGRLAALAQAYVRFATRDAALLELMFAGKHRPGAADGLRAAADRAYAAPLRLIATVRRPGTSWPATSSGSRRSPGPRSRGWPRWPTAACSATRRSTRSSPRRSTASCSGCARADPAYADRAAGGRDDQPRAAELDHVLAGDLAGAAVGDVVVERATAIGHLAGAPPATARSCRAGSRGQRRRRSARRSSSAAATRWRSRRSSACVLGRSRVKRYSARPLPSKSMSP